jgi:TolB protein
MNYSLTLFTSLTSFSLACAPVLSLAQNDQPPTIIIEAPAQRLIPISLSGYSGEVLSVLRFDLEVAGFEIVAPESAQFNVSGNNQSSVEGQVVERATKAVVLENRRYQGGTARSQAHAFSDEIVLKITGQPGIARTKIAFRGESNGATEIYLADYDGANALAVTRDRALVGAPAWVPGRRTLYYTSYRAGGPDVYLHHLDTGERRAIAQFPGLNTSAAVSPDGRRVALILSKGGSPDVYVCDADGSNLKQLTQTREDESSPCWSPDGRTICFVSRRGGAPALYTISADGGNLRRLSVVGAGSVSEPDWSPDGKWIVFTAMRRVFEVCVVPSGGGEAKSLATGYDPAWAPNSRTVIFTRRDKGRQILSLLDVPTKRVKDVAQNLGNCSQPCWAK